VNIPAIERFLAKVEITGREAEACWVWQGGTNDAFYGRFFLDGQLVYAHRFSYEFFVGPIPDGQVLDHLCLNPGCVRPSHLEAVTQRENLMRGDTIPRAHAEGRDCGQAACASCRWSREPLGASS